jgi:hypothetical protein
VTSGNHHWVGLMMFQDFQGKWKPNAPKFDGENNGKTGFDFPFNQPTEINTQRFFIDLDQNSNVLYCRLLHMRNFA